MLRTTLALASLGLVSSLQAGDTFYSLDGPSPDHSFAWSIATGDLDADGIKDLVVGAPNMVGPNGLTRAYSGRTGAQLFAFSFASGSGVSVASGGDLDGDGHDDLVISGDGFARVRSGKTGGSLWAVANDGFEDRVLIMPDTNLDGCDDVVVASPNANPVGTINGGVVRIYSGKTGGLLSALWGEANYQHLGTVLANAGDVNNDGRGDFLVTSWKGASGVAEVHVVAGGLNYIIKTIVAPAGASLYFGAAIAGGGDVNGDGYDDIVVGDVSYHAPGSGGNGRVHVYSGLNLQTLFSMTGPANAQLGSAVACVDDVNGDGKADVAISAPVLVSAIGGGQVAKGRVQIVSGVNGAVLRTWYGPDAIGQGFGARLAAIRLDSDSQGDLVVADPTATTVGGNTGRVTLYSGDAKIGGWSNYGTGFAGALGVPSLTASGTLAICEPNTLTLTNSNGANALPALFFVGSSMIDLQTAYGGKLLVVPVSVIPVVVPTSGLNVPFTVCDTMLLGAQFRLQAVEMDPTAAKGVSFSRGMTITLGL
jgi:FG-GAP-like repeat/FG-GAP repeat